MLGDKKVIECAKLTSFFASKNLTKVIKNEIIGSYFFQQENYISSGPRSLQPKKEKEEKKRETIKIKRRKPNDRDQREKERP